MSQRASYADMVLSLKEVEIGVSEDVVWAISLSGNACRDTLMKKVQLVHS